MATSPVLIGAITVLIMVVALFFSYNANRGLPFVQTYDLRVQLPNASQLVRANDVRMGGFRVGVVNEIIPRRRPDGTTYAELEIKLDRVTIDALPVDSRVIVRSRSPLGFKFVEIIPGSSPDSFPADATIPLSAARPRPVEIDQVLNVFTVRTRRGIRGSLVGLGNGLAGRGGEVNLAIEGLPPLLAEAEPAMRRLAAPRTRLARLVPALARAARIVAPAAETQGDLVVALDATFGALARVARPHLEDAIAETPATLETGISDFPLQRPVLDDAAALARELGPGVARLPSLMPQLNAAMRRGTPALADSGALNVRLGDLLEAVEEFSTDPTVSGGIERLDDTLTALDPLLHFLTPAQTTCNYATLWLRNTASLLSEGDANGTWQRFMIIIVPGGPNSESGPAAAPANGPDVENHLHANPYPNTAAPGQPLECEAGNEPYVVGRTVVGNSAGNQGTRTDGQAAQR
jgi:ABC-type transporter Mla subunit MlaD